jgi:hypothetical protein
MRTVSALDRVTPEPTFPETHETEGLLGVKTGSSRRLGSGPFCTSTTDVLSDGRHVHKVPKGDVST